MIRKKKFNLSVQIPAVSTKNALDNDIAAEQPPPLRPGVSSSSASTSSSSSAAAAVSSGALLRDTLATLNPADVEYLGVLGHGSFSTVYRVKYRQEFFALKLIKLDVSRNATHQLAAEMRALQRAGDDDKCDTLVDVVDAFLSDGSVAILLELMAGGSLRCALRLSSDNKLPSERAAAAVAQRVLLGLHYLHKQLHVIHRDLKPANLLFDSQARIKIADFGVSGQLENTLGACHSYVGTVAYMSPERVKDEPYTSTSDIWSFGLTLAEALLGCYPYDYAQHAAAAAAAAAAKGAAAEGLPAAAPPLRPALRAQQPADAARARGNAPPTFWKLLRCICSESPPQLPPAAFSANCVAFIASCLRKDPHKRCTAAQLLKHPFIEQLDWQDADQRQFKVWLDSNANQHMGGGNATRGGAPGIGGGGGMVPGAGV